MQNTLMEEKDNKFGSLGGGHTALLSYHSHRGYFKALHKHNVWLACASSMLEIDESGIYVSQLVRKGELLNY